MAKNYLLFASLTYAYSILRPLQAEIRRRGDRAAWYLEEECPDQLLADEERLMSFEEVKRFNPIAVFAPGNWVYDFFPGVKVEVFHGYPMRKRIEKIDDHFTLRGWFDIYCTQGPSSTPYFKQLEKQKGYFKVYETGWCKVDPFFSPVARTTVSTPTILYAPTFTRSISSAWIMRETIAKMAKAQPWKWIITFHPKITDAQLIESYEKMAEDFPNVEFRRFNKGLETFKESSLLLCDSSSIIVEYELTGKPVVTLRNTHPGDFLIDVQEPDEVEAAIVRGLQRPSELMAAIERYTAYHEVHRDGHNCARVLDAVDQFIQTDRKGLKSKPLNLLRKLKLRKRLHYYHWSL